jgi:hypothetical protein
VPFRDQGMTGARCPQIIGAALRRIGADPEVAETLCEILQAQRMIAGGTQLTLVPAAMEPTAPFLAARG